MRWRIGLISILKWTQSSSWIWVSWSKIRCFPAGSSFSRKARMAYTGCATWPWKTRWRSFLSSRRSTCSHTRTLWRSSRSKKATSSPKSWLVACGSPCESSRPTYRTCNTMAASGSRGRSKNQVARNRLVWIRSTPRSVRMTNYREKLRPLKTMMKSFYYHSTQWAVITTRTKTTLRRSSVSVGPKTFCASSNISKWKRKTMRGNCKESSIGSKARWLTLEKRFKRSFLTLMLSTKRDARKPSTNWARTVEVWWACNKRSPWLMMKKIQSSAKNSSSWAWRVKQDGQLSLTV